MTFKSFIVIFFSSIALLHNFAYAEASLLQGRIYKESLIYKDFKQKQHYYSLSLPLQYKSRPLPILVFLHGKGGNENSNLYDFSRYVHGIVSNCKGRQPIIVFPSNRAGLYKQDQNHHLAIGILDKVSNDYSLAPPSKRVIAGFSLGGAFATRTAIVNPDSFAESFSWAGGVWNKDQFLFSSIFKNKDLLNQRKFKLNLYLGDKDKPLLYNPLTYRLTKQGINYKKLIIKDQQHDLGKYLDKTRSVFGARICSIFS